LPRQHGDSEGHRLVPAFGEQRGPPGNRADRELDGALLVLSDWGSDLAQNGGYIVTLPQQKGPVRA
jgi:hypothetical protein